MPAFTSPVADPSAWTFTTTDSVTIPPGLRYAGYAFRGLQATRAAAAAVHVPATGVLRRVTAASGQVFVEVQVNPFPIRHVALAIPGGLPTFYLVFADAAGLTFTDGEAAPGGETLRTASAVTIVAAGTSRLALDPALWATQIHNAIATASGDASSWQPFAAAVTAATATGDAAPVLLYDHRGQLRTAGQVAIIRPDGAEFTVTLAPVDGGDLQRTVARLHATDPGTMPIANLWGGGVTAFRLRPQAAAPGDVQLVLLGSGAVAATEITVTPAERHVAFTNLADWFAPQSAATGGAGDLARFSRGNVVTPLLNGPAYFDDFFTKLRDAQRPDGGVHLAGWSMFPQSKLTKRKPGDDPEDELTLAQAADHLEEDNIPVTLEQAATLIAEAGGASRFLSAKFIQFNDGDALTEAEMLAVYLIVAGILVLNAFGVKAAKTDATGGLILLVAWIGATAFTAHVVDENGDPVEPNKDAVEILGAVANAVSRFAPYPVTVDDHVPAPDTEDFPFDAIFTVMRQFGLYHQKTSVVKVGSDHFGYVGGVDCNPNRLDDVDHLARSPYHDVHARIEGNAVRDVALTFDQRWQREGGGQPAAFPPPAVDPGLAPGHDVVQIARTYFAPAAGGEARALPFAPNGDRTIAATLVAAVEQARESIYLEDQYFTPPAEFRQALLAKVVERKIRQLIIVVTNFSGQLFGEATRDAFLAELVEADAGAGIVRIGYARRRFTSTDNSIRASSGKLLLKQDLPAGGGTATPIFLGPPARLPAVPFWVSVEGELIYVYDESGVANPDSQNMKAFLAERGEATQIIAGGTAPAGAFARAHKAGAPATAVTLADIYVHAKLMIVDDVFLCLGSANFNRRGFYYDGEIQCFTIPDALRASPRNPALLLRQQIWAEMLDLPAEMMAPLLADPVAAGALLDRSPFAGNRFTRLDAQPPHLMLGYTTGDGAVADIFQGLGFLIQAVNYPTIFQQIVDPASRTEETP